jgi:catechol 2,3-dioxygenase-like lactoylglutathione lyase family enzyme
MNAKAVSIRPFIGAQDFELSRNFYKALGWEEIALGPDMSVFKTHTIAFYLQKAYVKDWVDNTMLFVEVENVEQYWEELNALGLPEKFNGARLAPIRHEDWGSECFLHDPSGILWHFGQFSKK